MKDDGPHSHDIDMMIDVVRQPPKELSVEVRVLQDCGEVMTEQVGRSLVLCYGSVSRPLP